MIISLGGFYIPAAALLVAAHLTTAAEPEEQVFGADRIAQIEIRVNRDQVGSLRSEPRLDVPAIVQMDGREFLGAKLHLKGHGSFRPVDEKPNFAVRLHQRPAGNKAFGRDRLLLNNSSQDPSFLRWKLASELFLSVGYPAARINFAQVKFNERDLGLYLLIEPVDKVFLSHHFGASTGNLYEGSNTDVEDPLELDSGDSSRAQRDLQSLADACREPDQVKRWPRLQESLDVNRFAEFLALEVLVGHHDGYSLDRNNFRIYRDPKSNRMVFIPHGMDLIFNHEHLPLDGPWKGTVARAFMETPEGQRLFRQRMVELVQVTYGSDYLEKRLDALSHFLRENARPFTSNPPEFDAAIEDLRHKLQSRKKLALAQVISFANHPKGPLPTPTRTSPSQIVGRERMPDGVYSVSLEWWKKQQALTLVVRDNQAQVIESSDPLLAGMSAKFQRRDDQTFYIFFQTKDGQGAGQVWFPQADGSFVIQEIPNRGEHQRAVLLTTPR